MLQHDLDFMLLVGLGLNGFSVEVLHSFAEISHQSLN